MVIPNEWQHHNCQNKCFVCETFHLSKNLFGMAQLGDLIFRRNSTRVRIF
jgi:hypothetical protein